MQGILALDTAGKNYVQWYPTTNGDWLIGSSIANGGNIRGVNGYYGTNATITGTVNTNSLITNNLTATQNIITKEAIRMGMKGLYASDDDGKDYVQWYPTTNGDWLIGSSIANGGNIRGVNGYYGTNATITGTINTNNLITNTLTATQGIITKENLLIGAGKATVYTTSKGKFGAYAFSDDTGNLIIQSNNDETVKGGGIATLSYTLANLPKPVTDHVMVWCSDCKINGIAGAPVWWHASIAKWTDSQNNTLTN